MCDPPCGEHENCDEITGQCICDPAFREEEICRMRQGKYKVLINVYILIFKQISTSVNDNSIIQLVNFWRA